MLGVLIVSEQED